jgi:tRNA A37 threonylcarbamoyladenosine synthetase subunit TsaC/SUA5/YrdC
VLIATQRQDTALQVQQLDMDLTDALSQENGLDTLIRETVLILPSLSLSPLPPPTTQHHREDTVKMRTDTSSNGSYNSSLASTRIAGQCDRVAVARDLFTALLRLPSTQ